MLISSIDVFPRITDADESFDCTSQKNHPYGQNRLFLEQFGANHFPSAHIVRLPGLFGLGLKKNVIFDLLNANQLEKIHPDSQFQWYGLSRLWADIQLILDNDVRLMMMATEPVATQSIQGRFFLELAIGADATAPVFYNIKTRYADLFNGHSRCILSQAQILTDTGQFIQHPLRLLSSLPLIGAFLNVLYSVWVVLVNIFKSNVAEGWTTLSMQNSIMFFILFTILAILSEYTSRLMMTNQNRPIYIITKESRSLFLTRKQQISVVSSRDKIAADNEESDPDKL